MERAHPKLRRVTRGEPLLVDPTLAASPSLVSPRSLVSNSLATTQSLVDEHHLPLSEKDSCYSSCSEESHSVLSRESSDGLECDISNDFSGISLEELQEESSPTPVPPAVETPLSMTSFARNLGYSEDQLNMVLATVGIDAGQDRVLAELVKLARPGDGASRHRERPESAAPSHGGESLQNGSYPLRSVVIDGSNIAMTHGRKEVFSCRGIRDCVDYFRNRGHNDVLVFIPQFRKESARSDCPLTDPHLLYDLDKNGTIVWTPSRRINGRRIVCHDDRYILKTAYEKDAVIVSNDEYRDLVRETPHYSKLVETRLLMYSFVDGRFMPPDDPLGRHGPSLDHFLTLNPNLHGSQLCPYARKCTYGNKCKYFHPERPNGLHVSVTERLMREKHPKRTNNGRPSMQYEMLRSGSHSTVARTQSLQPTSNPNMENPRPLLLSVQPWHATVGRIRSMPITGRAREREDHLYAPSTDVWGHSELSVGPMMSNGQQVGGCEDEERARIQYNLCQLFPESVVMAVMSAHPEEMSSQALCERIIQMRKGFCAQN